MTTRGMHVLEDGNPHPPACNDAPSTPVVPMILCSVILLLMLTGCGSLQQLAMDKVGDALARGGEAYASDPDLELVGSASPFGLKLAESLIAESPRHQGLLLAAARGFTQYAYAFVELPADDLEERDTAAAYAARARARRLYLRARDYGLRGLEAAHAGFRAQLERDPASALAAMRNEDVPLLYWTAAAWGAAISLGKDDAAMLAGLAPTRRLAKAALDLDESYSQGALHVLHMSLAMSEPDAEPRRLARAAAHFERAVALSAGLHAAPFVAHAESVCVPSGKREEFDRMLDRALAIDVEAAPALRLSNELFQRRARWLRARAEQLFSN
jgi:predicted anti-sigma-YlaC factor YlaD